MKPGRGLHNWHYVRPGCSDRKGKGKLRRTGTMTKNLTERQLSVHQAATRKISNARLNEAMLRHLRRCANLATSDTSRPWLILIRRRRGGIKGFTSARRAS